MALCWRLCGANESLAQEMAQDAFVRAWQKLDTFRGDAQFTTWLHRLTVNVVLSDRRVRVRIAGRERPMDALTSEPGQDVQYGLDEDLEQCIARLPERARR